MDLRPPTLAGIVVAAAVLLGACAETELFIHAVKRIGGEGDGATAGPVYKVGKPYKVDGVWYYPAVNYNYSETGIASWYGSKFHGQSTANNEIYDMNKVTAAHRTLPLPSIVRVTNLENGRSIRLRVNDRGPFKHGRIIDLSRRGAQLLGFARKGTARVRVEIEADDSRQLAVQMTGQGVKDQTQTASTAKAVPRDSVTVQNLSGPGAASSGRPLPTSATKAKTPRTPNGTRLAALASPKDQTVTVVPVNKTRLFIQVGAFAQFHNAHRLKALISVLGPTKVTAVKLGTQQLFRVRLGPIGSVEAADRMLDRLIRAGYSSARLIVD